jgi:catechol 2,3-dioxygenase-like lactoylglutathione lyase family enzyme
MTIERIGHINIRTPLFAETMAFFERLFDLRRGPAATMADQENNGWLHGADGRPILHINALRADEAARPAGVDGRLDHVAFDCSDLPAMVARLDATGASYTLVDTRVPGLRQINLRDPNGIKIELTFGHEFVRK